MSNLESNQIYIEVPGCVGTTCAAVAYGEQYAAAVLSLQTQGYTKFSIQGTNPEGLYPSKCNPGQSCFHSRGKEFGFSGIVTGTNQKIS